MLDIKFIKENRDFVKQAVKSRNMDLDSVIDKLCKLDDRRLELIKQAESRKAKQNIVSKQVPVLKKEGKDVTDLFKQMKELSDEIKQFDSELLTVNEQMSEYQIGRAHV